MKRSITLPHIPAFILSGVIGIASLATTPAIKADTIGGGSIADPAAGPAPAFSDKIQTTGFVLVKNWKFGTGGTGTIKTIADMSDNFFYHDQFGTIGNGTNYGALTVAPDKANAIGKQPIEGINTTKPVREFLPDSMKTYIVPLNGTDTITPTKHNAGCGSFMAKWKLPNGGSLLGQDILWETRVRYVTPPYFWFAIWTAGNKWNKGAEMDTVESFGYDNGGGNTNYKGRYWHSDVVGEPNSHGTVSYTKNWGAAMTACGVANFDASQWHTWTWVYRKDDTFSVYMDGIQVQSGVGYWTLGSKQGATPVDMDFLVDVGWAHTGVPTVNHTLPVSALAGTYYEIDYSRVYLRGTPK